MPWIALCAQMKLPKRTMLATNDWEFCQPKKIIRIKLSSSGKFRIIFPHQGGVKKALTNCTENIILQRKINFHLFWSEYF